ncbi:MAG: hypothetical protein ACJ73S_21870 [Mycobacteriales bacterium]
MVSPAKPPDRGGPGRRRIDLTRLPAWVRYLLAAATVAVVVGLVWLHDPHRQAPAWYRAGVRIAAVGLLLAAAFWLVRRLARRLTGRR